jgi:hypothetical protein
MSLTNDQINVILKLHPQITVIRDGVAYDASENEVAYDLQSVIAQVEVDAQEKIAAKESALSKLTALGLTADEVKALLGVA